MAGDSRKTVYISRVDKYDVGAIKSALGAAFVGAGIDLCEFSSKKVVIKPNLVMKKSPDGAATTHPAVLEATVLLCKEAGIVPTVAESPGGIYSAARLEAVYRTCGIEDVSERCGCVLNYDVSYVKMSYEKGRASKIFDIITPIAEADVIIDLCKLKSHSLTKMSAAVKNLFGAVPGVTKFEMHAAHPNAEDFTSMLCDLGAMICENKTVISITDGIVGMEGEGPTGGTPRKMGILLVSGSPFVSDVLAAELLGFERDGVPLVAEATKRGLAPRREDIQTLGERAEAMRVDGFVLPRSQNIKTLKIFSQGALGKFFMPRPKITKKCRGCGECVRSCPQKTISLEGDRAKINGRRCIRCYCCQELCPFVAIKIRRNPIISIISKIK